jgi:hypothetical protein
MPNPIMKLFPKDEHLLHYQINELLPDYQNHVLYLNIRSKPHEKFYKYITINYHERTERKCL